MKYQYFLVEKTETLATVLMLKRNISLYLRQESTSEEFNQYIIYKKVNSTHCFKICKKSKEDCFSERLIYTFHLTDIMYNN